MMRPIDCAKVLRAKSWASKFHNDHGYLPHSVKNASPAPTVFCQSGSDRSLNRQAAPTQLPCRSWLETGERPRIHRFIEKSLRRKENFSSVRILHFGPTRKAADINVTCVRCKRARHHALLAWNWNSVRNVAFFAFCFRRRRSSSYGWLRWSRARARTGGDGCIARRRLLDIVFTGSIARRRLLLRMSDRVAERLQ
jgi:hypothetical protein